jgi:hypothetical protein
MTPETLERLLHENECTYLDFKRDQYPFQGSSDPVRSELLKDLLAFANSDHPGDRFILIGVEEVRGGRAKVRGVTTHLNDHDLQQFVSSKTQRPLIFSYSAELCDGLSIGVLKIPPQERPIYLKGDFAKLRKNIAYYRLGSTTREATPEEIMSWGQVAQAATPKIDIQLAQIAQPDFFPRIDSNKAIGAHIKSQNRYSSDVTAAVVLELSPPPSSGGVSESQYFSQFCKFLRKASMLVPLGFHVVNVGDVAAKGVMVHLTTSTSDQFDILPQDRYPFRPLSTRNRGSGLYASHSKPGPGDVVVRSGSVYEIEWAIDTLIPRRPTCSKGTFLFWPNGIRQCEFNCSIFGENIPRPFESKLVIEVEQINKDFSLTEIRDISNAFTEEDVQHRRGRVA